MKKNKNKKFRVGFKKKIIFSVIILFIFFSFLHPIFAQYQNQEKIPGAEPTDQFIPYVQSIITFGFAILGILALFMLIIGAYQYLMAAGNIGKVDSAKETVGSALLGLILGLCAWIILYKINPDLVNFRAITPISGGAQTTPTGNQQNNNTAQNGQTGNGSCDAGQGACQTASLSCFGSAAGAASQVCGYESGGGNPLSLSKTDITQDGKSFSVGLFQLNLTQHDLGMGCTSAFSGKNKNATVVNQSLYDQCVAKAQDPSYNISYACQLYKNRGNFGDWKNTANKCGLS